MTITGLVRGWRFANSGDRLKLTNISQWGPLQLGNDGGYFWALPTSRSPPPTNRT